jgi:predicted nucleic acid-binding protein
VGINVPILTRLLDSVILIDHLNGVPEANQFVLAIEPEQTAISVITRAEILVGIEPEDAPLVKALLDQFRLLVIDKPIADLAADLRKSQGWKLPDAFQAALCICHKIKLVTRNTKDFDPVRHDFVEIPYTLKRT